VDDALRFQALVMESLSSLYSYALTLTHRKADAEDLLQDALLRAFRGFATFDRALSFKAWALAIIRHAHVDQQRRHRHSCDRAAAVPPEDLHFDPAECDPTAIPLDPEGILLRGETVERVREAIRQLPAEFREVVELRDIEGLRYQEIAHVIGRPVGTVMSRLYRGRNLLRTHLIEPRPDSKNAEVPRGL
jgi:RNA polymerase sigma-70 factor (ECF subfamily)